MADRKEVQAGDDAVGANDQPQQGQQDQNQPQLIDGLDAEESRLFREMQENSPTTTIDRDAGDDNAGQTGRDVNADADAAARAAIAAEGQQQPAPGQPPAQQAAADDEDDDAGDEPDPTEGGKFPQRVSYQKYQRARTKAQKTAQELATTKEQLTRIDERYKQIVEALKTSAAAPAQPGQQEVQQQADPNDLGPMPDPEQDIFAYAKWQQKKIDQLEGKFNQSAQQQQQVTAESQLKDRYTRDVNSFLSQTPDFKQAYEFLMSTRVVELGAQFFGLDLTDAADQQKLTPEQLDRISKAVEADERALAEYAYKNNQSPPKQLYVMARARGYRPAPAQQQNGQQGNGQQPNGNGQQAPAANGTGNGQARSAVGDAVRAAKQGVATNQSLSNAGGAPEGMLTREQVMTMNDDDFAVFMNTASKAQLEAVFGT